MKKKIKFVVPVIIMVFLLIGISLYPIRGFASSNLKEEKICLVTEKILNLFNRTDRFYSVATSSNAIWVTTHFGSMMFSPDGGENWERQDTGVKAPLLGVHAVSEQNIIAVGGNGTIINSMDGGKSWEQIESHTTEQLFKISFSDTNVGWVVGAYATLLVTKDGGQSWEKVVSDSFFMEGNENSIPIMPMLNDVFFIDNKVGWIVGEQGFALRTTDGGQTWEVKNHGIDPIYLTGICFKSHDNGIAMGEKGSLFVTRDGGESWGKKEGGDNNAMYAAIKSNGDYLAVGDNGKAFMINSINKKFTPLFPYVNLKNRWLSDISLMENGNKIACGKNIIMVSKKVGNSADRWTLFLPVN